ncbi:hypothetical protein O181_066689 [Austropuccinia psidii MF-1]|uniref:Uncharacterized protein n=1 Tax=Austropuccinia psidii MF-1 TaxID=1389203 RepID=A0A9Q3I5S9_9BASI|nr:hypothetical protein [Austropuccinia psidii MF-1]
MLSQQMSLNEHNSPNTQRKTGKSEELANELTNNTFYLISTMKIATSWTVSMDNATAFSEHWKKFHLSNQHLFPKQESKPIHHFADHIPELLQCWGPGQASATWCYKGLIGVFAKIVSACDSNPEHKHDSQNTINQWCSQDTTKIWN